MNTKELSKYIGQTVNYSLGDLVFEVTIEDCRVRFGNIDFLVSPKKGSGKSWLASTSLGISIS